MSASSSTSLTMASAWSFWTAQCNGRFPAWNVEFIYVQIMFRITSLVNLQNVHLADLKCIDFFLYFHYCMWVSPRWTWLPREVLSYIWIVLILLFSLLIFFMYLTLQEYFLCFFQLLFAQKGIFGWPTVYLFWFFNGVLYYFFLPWIRCCFVVYLPATWCINFPRCF